MDSITEHRALGTDGFHACVLTRVRMCVCVCTLSHAYMRAAAACSQPPSHVRAVRNSQPPEHMGQRLAVNYGKSVHAPRFGRDTYRR